MTRKSIRTAQSGDYFLFGKRFGALTDDSWELYLHQELSGQMITVSMHGFADTQVTADAPTPGQWSHIAATWDGMTLRLWHDGVTVGEAPIIQASFDTHDVRFGCDSDADVDVYNLPGLLADLRIYGRALTPIELAALASDVPTPP